MGNLRQLSILDISQNKSLRKLPKSLGYVQQLAQLNIDGLNLLYPPQDILNGGTIVIIAFLANESGIEYSPEDSISETDLSRNISSENVERIYQNKNNDVQVSCVIGFMNFDVALLQCVLNVLIFTFRQHYRS